MSCMFTYSLNDNNELDPAVLFIIDPFRLHECMSLFYRPAVSGVRPRLINIEPQLDQGKY